MISYFDDLDKNGQREFVMLLMERVLNCLLVSPPGPKIISARWRQAFDRGKAMF